MSTDAMQHHTQHKTRRPLNWFALKAVKVGDGGLDLKAAFPLQRRQVDPKHFRDAMVEIVDLNWRLHPARHQRERRRRSR